MIALMNGVVARLAKERPGLVVETLGGYQYAADPPRTVKPDARLRVLWADWERGVRGGYASDDYARRRGDLDAWVRAFDGRVTVYQYYADYFKHSWFLGPLAEQMVSDREYVLAHGIDGVLTLLYPDGYWWRSSINAWLAGRIFYDATSDPFVLLREYALAYYGAAGEPMAAYLDAWARDVTLGVRSRSGAMGFHLGALRQQRRTYLTEAERLSAGDPVTQRRVATTVRMHRLAELIMGTEIARTQAAKLLADGDVAGARRELDGARNNLAAAKALADQLATERRGLIDPEINGSVFTPNEQEIAALEEKLTATAVVAPSPGTAPAQVPSVKP
ncbi:DUF4838 domain-containing protein [Candidatus Binatia bacterium]|nr:DUF4838 domain-containing protein [Candidatus Binatia bacterium]